MIKKFLLCLTVMFSFIFYVNAECMNEELNEWATTVEGKLMTYEEANSLNSDIINDMNNYYYWLGSARDQEHVWIPDSYASANYTLGLRPVITVFKTNLYN